MLYKTRLKAAFVAAAFAFHFFANIQPLESMGMINILAYVTDGVGLFGSPVSTLTTAPGQTGASITLMTDQPASPAGNFTGTVNFGNLAGGDGSPTIASFALRERGNGICHVSASVASYTATNLSFNSGSGPRALGGVSGTELNFVTLGNGDITAGSGGNPGAASYGPKFQGADTLNQLNNGAIGNVSTSSDEFVTFSASPSNSGNLLSPNNYVQDIVTFSVPTGFVWSPTNNNNSGTGSFSISVQFEIYTGP